MKTGRNTWIAMLLLAALLLLPLPHARAEEAAQELLLPLDEQEEQLSVGETSAQADGITLDLNTEEVSDEPQEPWPQVGIDADSTSLSLGEDEDPIVLDAPEPEDGAMLGQGDGEMLGAGFSVGTSCSYVRLKAGTNTRITVNVSCAEVCTIQCFPKSRGYTLEWASKWYNNNRSIDLRITGSAPCSDVFTVRMTRQRDGAIVAECRVTVQIIPNEQTKLWMTYSSLSIERTRSVEFDLVITGLYDSVNLNYGGSNLGALDIQAGNAVNTATGQYKIHYTITGRSVANGELQFLLYLQNGGGLIAWKAVKFSVYQKQEPKVSLSSAAIGLAAGASTNATVSVSGYNGQVTLEASPSNSNVVSAGLSQDRNNNIILTVTGRNAGTAMVYVYMWEASTRRLLAATYLQVTVNAVARPSLKALQSTVQTNIGRTVTARLSYANCVAGTKISWSGGGSFCTPSWVSVANGTATLNIRGVKEGSGFINVSLSNGTTGETYCSASFRVVVSGKSIQDVAYGFANHSVNWIDRRLCRYIAGNNEIGNTLYYKNAGDGGVCFGMASSAAMLNVASEQPTVSSFNIWQSTISKLRQNDRNGSLNLTVEEFIQTMHVAQYLVDGRTGLGTFISVAKSEIDNGRPIIIGLGTQDASSGHAVMAFGYRDREDGGVEFRIYDSNGQNSAATLTESTLTITKSGPSYAPSYSFSYPRFTNARRFFYWRYSDIMGVWNNRSATRFSGYNLLASREQSFSLYDIDGSCVLKVSGGQVLSSASDVSRLPDFTGSGDGTLLFKLPVDYYTVVDDTPGTPIDMMLSNQMLSVRVDTEADSFSVCADDASNIANASMEPREGENYTIVIGCSLPDQPDETRLSGTGNGTSLTMGLVDGVLTMSGDANATLSVGSDAPTYGIYAGTTEGGAISPSGATEVAQGMDQAYEITPDEGCSVKAVYVDGENVGAVRSYTFEGVDRSHSIEAEFCRDIGTCTVALSQGRFVDDGSAHTPRVTLTDPSGRVLIEDVDYVVGYADNEAAGTGKACVTAVKGGDYFGVAVAEFEIVEGTAGLLGATWDASGNAVQVRLNVEGSAVLVAASYRSDGRMLDVRLQNVSAADQQVTLSMGEGAKDGEVLRVFLCDEGFRPISPKLTLRQAQ